MSLPWAGKWISDPLYHFDSPASPVPMVFRRRFTLEKPAKQLRTVATAMGIFDMYLDGKRLSEEYFNPGFTDYSAQLQYVLYETEEIPAGSHEFMAVVVGGWAVGRSTHIDDTTKSRSKLSADRQALLAELHFQYADGSSETIASDGCFEVTEDGPWRFADWYDGEIYDARISLADAAWHPAEEEKLQISPHISARWGCAITAHEVLEPVEWVDAPSGELICDFGQNIAGVLSLQLHGNSGQEIVIRHAEALQKDGELYVQNLRTAKQELRYVCRDGEQEYSPRLTFMGFRYAGISGIRKEDIRIKAIAVYSDFRETGSFRCSNEDLNRLQSNLRWSGKDNFVDIPTDCPQRDERQGWTGDIALYSSTACFNFDMSRFLGKWLLDLISEMHEDGSLPFVIPSRKGITPVITTSCWSDCCVLVPWAVYLSDGDKRLLSRQYPAMKRYLEDVKRYAAMSAAEYGSPHIFKYPFQFGDWCAPTGTFQEWSARGPMAGTPYYYQSCRIMSRIAGILGEDEESEAYAELAKQINDDYLRVFTDGTGRMKEECQTAYVLPLAFGMGTPEQRHVMTERLWVLVRENGIHLDTGFPAAPYLLFALADNGLADEAYELLLQDSDPSWLYQIRHGATTIWEQWGAICEDGSIKEASLNHYAYGAVGDFFYRRICGLQASEPGYRRFDVKPVPGGGLSWAECEHKCPYGLIKTRWERKDGQFCVSVTVPIGTECRLTLPDGETHMLGSGDYQFQITA